MFDDALVIAILQIIAIDIILGGDNAIIIALACRNLPQRQKRLGILWGTAGAIILRVILVFFASTLLTIPSLKLIGGLCCYGSASSFWPRKMNSKKGRSSSPAA